MTLWIIPNTRYQILNSQLEHSCQEDQVQVTQISFQSVHMTLLC